MRKICVITGTRAEYGLLYWTMKGLQEDPDIELQVCVTGMHLSPEFGLTYKQIETDGFPIHKKVEILLSSDTDTGISKSIGLGVIGFADAFEALKPDMILVLGDRYEIFAAATAALIAKIPIAHCHGGETTEGAFDEALRHSVTKMSHLHFTSTEAYKHRVIQLGEQPERVFNVGALGIENINKLKLLSKEEFEESIDFSLGKKNLLVTFHPVTLEHATAESQFQQLLEALDRLEDIKVIFTKPNSDTNGRALIRMIDEYVRTHPEKAVAFTSLGQLRYLSAMLHIDAVVGNSSSGLLEVPSFHIGTVNIGDRQKGRISGESVIHCQSDTAAIFEAIKIAIDPVFKNKIAHSRNPYGNGNSSEQIINLLKTVKLEGIVKKKFYDMSSDHGRG